MVVEVPCWRSKGMAAGSSEGTYLKLKAGD